MHAHTVDKRDNADTQTQHALNVYGAEECLRLKKVD